MSNWVIGDGVVNRYGETGKREMVRVNVVFEKINERTRHYWRTSFIVDGKVIMFSDWKTIHDALRKGEEWLP